VIILARGSGVHGASQGLRINMNGVGVHGCMEQLDMLFSLMQEPCGCRLFFGFCRAGGCF
jgi:hypothetical protein